MKKPVISGLNPEIWQACYSKIFYDTRLVDFILTIVERENTHPYPEHDKSNHLLAITLKDIVILLQELCILCVLLYEV